jgi:hypothetical protein
LIRPRVRLKFGARVPVAAGVSFCIKWSLCRHRPGTRSRSSEPPPQVYRYHRLLHSLSSKL